MEGGDRCKYTYYYNMFQRNGRFFTHPNLPQGKEQVTPNIGFSPHLSSPVGEGQIPSVVWLSDYQ